VPFANVAASEQKHMDAMLEALCASTGCPIPPAGNAIGEFTDPDLQKLYDKLVDKGLKGPDDALLVGGLIEEVDMVDIQDALDRATQTDIDAVYASLMCGSRNHLRAFATAYEALTGKRVQGATPPAGRRGRDPGRADGALRPLARIRRRITRFGVGGGARGRRRHFSHPMGRARRKRARAHEPSRTLAVRRVLPRPGAAAASTSRRRGRLPYRGRDRRRRHRDLRRRSQSGHS